MTEIRFYHLQNQPLEMALPALLSKAYEGGHRIVVRVSDDQQLKYLNEHLWTYNPNSFLPHGTKAEGNAEEQPIWLTVQDENPNQATVLVTLSGGEVQEPESYDLICDIFDGRNEETVNQARKRWKEYKGEGLKLTYWQQNERGGWDKKS